MTEEDWAEKLRQEGFTNIYIWRDDPDVLYPDHKHPFTAAHVILDGEMSLRIKGEEMMVLKAGDRFDVEAHEIHNAQMGKEGCRYIVGQKK